MAVTSAGGFAQQTAALSSGIAASQQAEVSAIAYRNAVYAYYAAANAASQATARQAKAKHSWWCDHEGEMEGENGAKGGAEIKMKVTVLNWKGITIGLQEFNTEIELGAMGNMQQFPA